MDSRRHARHTCLRTETAATKLELDIRLRDPRSTQPLVGGNRRLLQGTMTTPLLWTSTGLVAKLACNLDCGLKCAVD